MEFNGMRKLLGWSFVLIIALGALAVVLFAVAVWIAIGGRRRTDAAVMTPRPQLLKG